MEQTIIFDDKKIYDWLKYSVLASTLLCIIVGLIVNHIFALIGLMLFCFGALVLNFKDTTCQLCFFVHFAAVFKYSADGMSLFTICQLFVLFVWAFLREKKIDYRVLLCVIIYLFYLLMGCFISEKFAFAEIVKQVGNILLLAIFIKHYPKEGIRTLLLYFVVGVLAASILGLFADSIPNFYDFVNKIDDWMINKNRFTGLNNDPNYYAIGVVLSLVIVQVLYTKKYIHYLLFWGLFIALSFFGVQTYSKSFLLMYALLLLIMTVQYFMQKNWTALLVIGLIGAVGLVMAFVEGNVINLTLKRLLAAEGIDELTTERWSLWSGYIKFVFSDIVHFLFGTGIGADLLALKGEFSIEAGVHNFYIEIVYYLGLIGALIFITALIFCFKQKPRAEKRKISNYYGWIVLAFMYFFLQMLFSHELIFQMFIAYSIFLLDENHIENEKR